MMRLESSEIQFADEPLAAELFFFHICSRSPNRGRHLFLLMLFPRLTSKRVARTTITYILHSVLDFG